MQAIISGIVGLIFGIGLIVSGMTNPVKVLGFLDLAGPWDPSLALVMGGAIAVSVFAFAVAHRMARPFLADAMRMPTTTDIDRHLVLGSLVFGAGWGLAGFCPGPALVAAGAGMSEAALFVSMMIAGMAVYELLQPRPETVKQVPTNQRRA